MSARDEVSVAILGAGACGLFLTSELASHRISCALLDEGFASSYSSTRNQGWLQIGSFDACMGLARVPECQDGFNYIVEHYPDAVHDSMATHFLFRFRDQCDEALWLCRQHEVAVDDLEHGDLEDLIAENPLLIDCEYRYALRTWDCSIDTSHILRELARKAMRHGARYYPVSTIQDIQPERDGNGWRVPLPSGGEISCQALVLACGATTPAMAHRLHSTSNAWNPPIYKVAVLVLRDSQKLTTSTLFAPFERMSPCISSFWYLHGTTVRSNRLP
ncbi:FAD-dependent oxidoreductase [Streptomyces lavendulae]|uniref:NAD(P)/FAD-dependent oxidoreductase n=1 Tax=Streptomyces lavendulae TaxID=1914 RepID=UPI0033F444BD